MMNAERNEERIAGSTVLSDIKKLQSVMLRIDETSRKSLLLMQTKDNLAAGHALAALGICQQAREQVAAACRNLGISSQDLFCLDQNGAGAEEQRLQLTKAKIRVIRELLEKIRLSKEAVLVGMHAFAEESAIIASMMLSRADEQLSRGARAGGRLCSNKRNLSGR